MAEFNLTNKAVEDLTKIWENTYYKWSEKEADRYYEMLLEIAKVLPTTQTLEKIIWE